jgi:hypothetical protein
VEVAFFAKKAFVSDKKPDLAVENVVNLFGFMLMRFGMVPRPAGGDHQTAFITITFPDHHRTGSSFAALNSIVFGNLCALEMQGHNVSSYG